MERLRYPSKGISLELKLRLGTGMGLRWYSACPACRKHGFYPQHCVNQSCHAITALERWKQEDHEFKVILGSVLINS